MTMIEKGPEALADRNARIGELDAVIRQMKKDIDGVFAAAGFQEGSPAQTVRCLKELLERKLDKVICYRDQFSRSLDGARSEVNRLQCYIDSLNQQLYQMSRKATRRNVELALVSAQLDAALVRCVKLNDQLKAAKKARKS